ncbi:S9 family peptidase [Sphingosinicella sp. LHD-64]|uniref:alpha/beta hydrolase family protein n=1 Tax=Sphingosinicella sp. LHD-64 TaxID=3072139 RepID=UPI00280D6EB5|nr:S9 family peptidase [Sphingosinicella sp. LHD-64]MDQ8755069.1 S9 family peptidase [Sphingosinicella sp. LHD-64]
MRIRLGGYLLLLLAMPAALLAQAPDMATAFGARESIESIALSPNGRRLAYVAPADGQASRLYTVDLDSGDSRVTTAADGVRQRLGGCGWVSDARLLCTVFGLTDSPGEIVSLSRLVALDSDGANIRVLGQTDSFYQRYVSLWGGNVIDWLPGQNGAVLMGQNFVPERRQGTNIERRENGYGVVRVDTANLSTRTVETARLNAARYVSDGHGTIRIMGMRPPRGETGMMGDVINYFYRAADSEEWRPLGQYTESTREGMSPAAVDRALNAAYVFQKLNGRMALYRLALDGSGRRELLVSHDTVDVAGLLRIGRGGRVIGASYVTETRQAVYFDPELQQLAAQLGRAMPNLPQIRFIDSSEDESRLLILAASDRDPGRYFLYDRGTRQLNEIMLARPQLENVTLAEVRAVSYRAADGTTIPAYLTLPPAGSGRGLPAIVLPHGGPEARDEWGFDWLAQYFANRGFAVLQPNFRGSAGYGDDWFRENGFQAWRTAIGDVNDAGRWLVSEGIANPARLAIVGWSYGGYAALQANVLDPQLFKAAVAIAPVTDLNLLKEEWRRWTSFAAIRDFVGSGPHVRDGSPAENAAAIRVPVLLFHGDLDRNVGIGQSRRMEGRLREAGGRVELVAYPGLDHQIEDSTARADMLRRSDAFLRTTLGLE